MVEAHCNNCDYTWDYQGDKEPPAEVSCPSCRYRMKAPEPEAA